MDAPHRATLSFEYDDEHDARTVARSVGLEAGEIDDDRSRTRVERDGRTFHVEIAAADLVALRAAANTWCSLVEVADRIAERGARADRR